MYYVGESENQSIGPVSVSLSDHTLMYGVEGGYNIVLLDKLLTIRPQIGVGNFTLSASSSMSSSVAVPLPSSAGSASGSNLYLEPGVTGLIALGQWFVGADANVLVLPGIPDSSGNSSTTDAAFTLHAQGGIRF